MTPIHRAIVIALLIGLLASGLLPAQDLRLRPTDSIYSDVNGAGISVPQGVAFDGESVLVVADSGNRRLLVFDLSAETIVARPEIRVPQIPYPTHVRLDSNNEILVLDGRKHQIGRVSLQGEFSGFLEINPGDDREDVIPKSFEVDEDDDLYVLDVAGGRIYVFDSSMALNREIDFGPDVGFLSDLAVSRGGTVFVVDSVNRQVHVARKDDTILTALTDKMADAMNFPTSIEADSRGNLFIGDEYAGTIVVLAQNGSLQSVQSRMGWKDGFLRYPSSLSVANDVLFVADRANNRVQRFEIIR